MTNKIKMSGLFGRSETAPTAAHDHLADTFPEETGDRRFLIIDEATPVSRIKARLVGAEKFDNRFAVAPGDVDLETAERVFAEKLAHLQRLADLRNSNAVYGKMGASVKGTLYDPEITALPSGGKMVSGSTDALREYITRDIEFTEQMMKRAEIDHIITEALFMQARGRSAPLPRPTIIAMSIRAVCDDIESWSRP